MSKFGPHNFSPTTPKARFRIRELQRYYVRVEHEEKFAPVKNFPHLVPSAVVSSVTYEVDQMDLQSTLSSEYHYKEIDIRQSERWKDESQYDFQQTLYDTLGPKQTPRKCSGKPYLFLITLDLRADQISLLFNTKNITVLEKIILVNELFKAGSSVKAVHLLKPRLAGRIESETFHGTCISSHLGFIGNGKS